MANDIVINIGAKDTASKVIASVGKSVVKLGKVVDGVGTKFQRIGKQIAGIGLKIGAVGAGIGVGVFAPLITAGSELEETMGKFNVVFEENAAVVQKWSEDNAAALGVSRQEMASMLSGMQDLLVPAGMVPDVAEDMSKSLATLAVDLGSFNNMETDQVFRDIMAAITGSSETMKKYGVISNEAAVKAELLNQAIDPKNATAAQKMLARYNIFLESTTKAQGDAIRTRESVANQWKRLTSIVKDVAGTLGGQLLPMLSKVMQTVTAFAGRIRAFIDENQQMAAAIVAGVGAAGALGAAIGVAAVTIGGSLAIIGAGISALVAGVTALGTIAGVVFSPIGIAIGAVAVAIGTLGTALGVLAVKTGIAADAWRSIGIVFDNILETARTTFKGITDAMKANDFALAAKIAWTGFKVAGLKAIEDIGIAIATAVPRWAAMLNEFLTKAIKGFASAAKKIAKVLADPRNWRQLSNVGNLINFGDMNLVSAIKEQRAAAEAELAKLNATAAEQAKKVGEAVAEGAGEGIMSKLPDMLTGLTGKIGEVAGGAIDQAAGFFDAVNAAAGVMPKEVTVRQDTPLQATESRLMTGGGATTTEDKILAVNKEQLQAQKDAIAAMQLLADKLANKNEGNKIELVKVGS